MPGLAIIWAGDARRWRHEVGRVGLDRLWNSMRTGSQTGASAGGTTVIAGWCREARKLKRLRPYHHEPAVPDRRDADHVQHAYTLPAPAAGSSPLMGEGVFFGAGQEGTHSATGWILSADRQRNFLTDRS